MQHLSGVTVQGPDLTSLPEPSPLPPAKQYQATVTQHPCVSIPTPCHLSDNINQLSHSTPVSVSSPLVTCQTISINCHTAPLCQYPHPLSPVRQYQSNVTQHPCVSILTPCHLSDNTNQLSHSTPVSVSPPLVTCQTVSVNCHTMLTALCQYSPYLVTCQTVSVNCHTMLTALCQYSPYFVSCQTVSVNCHTMLTALCQYSPYLVTCQTVSINCYTGLGVTPVAIYPVPCHLLSNISHLSYITRCHACVSVCHTC